MFTLFSSSCCMWKSRWAIFGTVSPITDYKSVSLRLFRDQSDSKKAGREKVSISLDGFLGIESGFQFERESHVLCVLFTHQGALLLAFPCEPLLCEWQSTLRQHLKQEQGFSGTLLNAPTSAQLGDLTRQPIKLLIHGSRVALVAHVTLPPRVLVTWALTDLRRYGVVDGDKFVLEGGQRCGLGCGQFVVRTEFAEEINQILLRRSGYIIESTLDAVPASNNTAPTPPKRPSLALAPKTIVPPQSTGPEPPLRQHSAPVPQGQGRAPVLPGQGQEKPEEAYCDEAWLRQRNHISNGDYDVPKKNSRINLNTHSYVNHIPTTESPDKIKSSGSFSFKHFTKHRLPIFHRHSRSSDNTVSQTSKQSDSKPPFPVAHAQTSNSNGAEEGDDFMNLNAYLWHTRTKGSAASHNLALEESILRNTKATQNSVENRCTTTKNGLILPARSYENQDITDAQLRLHGLNIDTTIATQGDKTLWKSAISPGALTNGSLSPHEFHCNMDLLDEVLQAVDNRNLTKYLTSSCNSLASNHHQDEVVAEQQQQQVLCTNIQQRSSLSLKADAKGAIHHNQTKSLSSIENRGDAIASNQALSKTTNVCRSIVHSSNVVDSTTGLGCWCSNVAARNSNSSIENQPNLADNFSSSSNINSSHVCSSNKDSDLSDEYSINQHCQNLSDSFRADIGNSDSFAKQVNDSPISRTQTKTTVPNHTTNYDAHRPQSSTQELDNRYSSHGAKLITAKSWPNVSIDWEQPVLLHDDQHCFSSISSICAGVSRPTFNTQSCFTMSSQPSHRSHYYPSATSHHTGPHGPMHTHALASSTATPPNRPLEFVDLSKFDGIDEGYLYWVKGKAVGGQNNDQQQEKRSYDNVPILPNSLEYINMSTPHNNKQTGYDNVNYATSKDLGHDYNNIGAEKRFGYSQECVNSHNAQTHVTSSCQTNRAVNRDILSTRRNSHHDGVSVTTHTTIPVTSTLYCNTGVVAGAATSLNRGNCEPVITNTHKVSPSSKQHQKHHHLHHNGKPPLAASNSTTVSATSSSNHTSPKHSSGWSGLAFHNSLRRKKKKTASNSVGAAAATQGPAVVTKNGFSRKAGSYVTLRADAQIETRATSSLCSIPIASHSPAGNNTSSHVAAAATSTGALLFVDYSDPHKDNLVNTITEQQQRCKSTSSSKHSPRSHKHSKTAEVANLMPCVVDSPPMRSSAFRLLDKSPHKSRHSSDFVMVKASSYNVSKKQANVHLHQHHQKSHTTKSESHLPTQHSQKDNKNASITSTKQKSESQLHSDKSTASHQSGLFASSRKLDTKVPSQQRMSDSFARNNGPLTLYSVPPSPRKSQPSLVSRECDYIDMSNPVYADGATGLCCGTQNVDQSAAGCTQVNYAAIATSTAPIIPPKLPPKPSDLCSNSSGRYSSNSSLASNASVASSHTNSSLHGSPCKIPANSWEKVISTPSHNASFTATDEYVPADRCSTKVAPELMRVNSAPATSPTNSNPSFNTTANPSPYMDMGYMLNSKTFPKTGSTSKSSSKSGSFEGPNSRRPGSAGSGYHQKLTVSRSLDNTLDGCHDDDPYLDMGSLDQLDSGDGNSSLDIKLQSKVPASVSTGKRDDYLPMKSFSRQSSKGSLRNSSSTIHEDSSEKPKEPFDLLDLEHYEKEPSQMRTSPAKTEDKCKEPEIQKPFELLDFELLDNKCARRESKSPSKLDTKSEKGMLCLEGQQTPPSVRRNSKSQGLFARLMRRNSGAKELAKISKSQEDILENDLNSKIPPSISPTKPKKEPVYAQISELKTAHIKEPYTMPLKKKEYLRLSSTESLLDPNVKGERGRVLSMTSQSSKSSWLEHGNLTDEQKQSCSSLLSDRSMTPPTPPPTLPLPPPPLPPRPGRTSLGAAPPVPPKTYLSSTSASRQLFSEQRKTEPEYADIDENGVYQLPRAIQGGVVPSIMTDSEIECKSIANDSVHKVAYAPQTHEQTTASFFPLGSSNLCNVVENDNGQLDYVKNPPPRPPRVLANERVCSADQSLDRGTSCDPEENEGDIWVERVFPRVKPKPGGRLRSLSLRSGRNSLSSDTVSVTSQHSLTSQQSVTSQPPSPFRTIDAQCVSSPAATVLRPRAGKEYQVIDRRRLLGGGSAGDEALSSAPSSGRLTPATSSSLQSSPTKSPASATGLGVFNFDPIAVEQYRHTTTATTSHTESLPRDTEMCTTRTVFRKGPLRNEEETDPIYMNLSFPNSFTRPGGVSPNETARRTPYSSSAPDYANVVLNYAEIDLSHNSTSSKNKRKNNSKNSSKKSSRDRSGPERGGAVIVSGGTAVTEYSVIDMVATMAASQAARDHVHAREEGVLKERHKRNDSNGGGGNSSTGNEHEGLLRDKENNSNSKRKERKSGPRGFLSRSHSSASRATSSAKDRKSINNT